MIKSKNHINRLSDVTLSRESQSQNKKIALLGLTAGVLLLAGPNALLDEVAIINEQNEAFIHGVETAGDIYGAAALTLAGIALAASRSREANKI